MGNGEKRGGKSRSANYAPIKPLPLQNTKPVVRATSQSSSQRGSVRGNPGPDLSTLSGRLFQCYCYLFITVSIIIGEASSEN